MPQLAESDRLFRLLVDSVQDYAIFMVDPDGCVVSWNQGAERLLGFGEGEILGRHFSVILPAEQRESGEADEALRVAAAEGRHEWEGWRVRKDGSRFWAHVTETAVRDETGQLVGFGKVIRDLTAVRRAQQLIQARARQQAAVAELGQLALAGAGLDDLFDRAARLVAERIGVELAKVLELLPSREAFLLRAGVGWDAGLVGHAVVGAELSSQAGYTLRSDQPVVVADLGEETRFHGPPLLTEHGVVSGLSVIITGRGEPWGVLGAHTRARRDFSRDDVTFVQSVANVLAMAIERSAVETELRRAKEAAEEANRAKGRFLAVMSHELRTPLTAIMGYTELLLTEIGGALNETQRQQLRRVDASSRHLLELIDEVLTLARTEDGEDRVRPERIELAELILDVAGVIGPAAAAKGLEFRHTRPDVRETITTDRRKLRQILLNLLSNAVKFTERGEVELKVELADDDVTFQVRDTGIGIPREYHAMLFVPFWQLEEAMTRTAGGTGLGLSIVDRFTRMLGGDVEVTSEPGKGSTFTVRLPRGGDSPPSRP